MAQKTNNPKQAEIELIEKLFAMDGYFAAAFTRAAFTRADVTMMECNINADYDLLCRTTRDESSRIAQLEAELKRAYETIDEKTKLVSELATERDGAIANFRAAQKDNDEINEKLYETAHEVERLKMQILRRDLQLGKEPTPEQRQSLIIALAEYEN